MLVRNLFDYVVAKALLSLKVREYEIKEPFLQY